MVFPLALTCLIFKIFPRKNMWWVVIVLGVGLLGSLSRGAQLGTLVALLAMGAIVTHGFASGSRSWLLSCLLFISLLTAWSDATGDQ